LTYAATPGSGDELMAVKAWKGAVREPTGWIDPPEAGTAPDASLEMRFVYGYRGWDCRNNIGFADSVYQIVYHIAGNMTPRSSYRSSP
jgi:hypothetical protein